MITLKTSITGIYYLINSFISLFCAISMFERNFIDYPFSFVLMFASLLFLILGIIFLFQNKVRRVHVPWLFTIIVQATIIFILPLMYTLIIRPLLSFDRHLLHEVSWVTLWGFLINIVYTCYLCCLYAKKHYEGAEEDDEDDEDDDGTDDNTAKPFVGNTIQAYSSNNTPPSQNTPLCPRCHSAVNRSDNFCPKCGLRFF